jgi:hypothetical protein
MIMGIVRKNGVLDFVLLRSPNAITVLHKISSISEAHLFLFLNPDSLFVSCSVLLH